MLFNFFFRTSIRARPCYKLQLRFHGVLLSLSSSSSSSKYSTTPSNLSNPHSFTVTYLINSCGLSPETAIQASRRLDLSKSPKLADSVLDLLKDQGFNTTQISNLIRRHPKILLSDPDNTLLSNFKTLNSIGISNADLVAIVTAMPGKILTKSLGKRALQSYNYLKSVLQSDDKVIHAIKRFPQALTYDLQVYAADNIQILRELSVPESVILSVLTLQPRTLFTSVNRFRKIVEDVKEMGFDPSKTRFLMAIHAIRAMSKSTWDKKVKLYKKWGWSEEHIFMAFEKYPGCMMASMDKIELVLDFLVNTMGWEMNYIVEWPIVICFSFEKRTYPRCMVYLYLEEKGLIEQGDDFSFNKWLMYSDTNFVKWVLKKYGQEAPDLLKVYRKHLGKANGVTPSEKRGFV